MKLSIPSTMIMIEELSTKFVLFKLYLMQIMYHLFINSVAKRLGCYPSSAAEHAPSNMLDYIILGPNLVYLPYPLLYMWNSSGNVKEGSEVAY